MIILSLATAASVVCLYLLQRRQRRDYRDLVVQAVQACFADMLRLNKKIEVEEQYARKLASSWESRFNELQMFYDASLNKMEDKIQRMYKHFKDSSGFNCKIIGGVMITLLVVFLLFIVADVILTVLMHNKTRKLGRETASLLEEQTRTVASTINNKIDELYKHLKLQLSVRYDEKSGLKKYVVEERAFSPLNAKLHQFYWGDASRLNYRVSSKKKKK